MRDHRCITRPASKVRLGLHPLEDRTTPTVSSITGNFNGTAIPAGDTLWLSSVAKVAGVGTDPVSLHVTSGTVSFSANGAAYTIAVPDATVTFTQLATQATTTYSAAGGWLVTAPQRFSGNVFLAGVPVPLPSGLPGGVKNVTWRADFSADTTGLKLNWQWAAAAYSAFGDPAGLGVKAIDDPKVDRYANSDHAGTPETFKRNVVGGATGGGGSNFTGSYSATRSVVPELASSGGPASIAGTVYFDTSPSGSDGFHVIDAGDQPLAGIEMDLWDAAGSLVASTVTGDDGTYSFGGLSAGTYTVAMVPGPGDGIMPPQIGSVSGGGPNGIAEVSGVGITGIQLDVGGAGTGYNLGVWQTNT
jgi:SdrD B-like domain